MKADSRKRARPAPPQVVEQAPAADGGERQCLMCGKEASASPLFMNSAVAPSHGVCLDCVLDCVRTGHQHIAMAGRYIQEQDHLLQRILDAIGDHPPIGELVRARAQQRPTPLSTAVAFELWLQGLRTSLHPESKAQGEDD